MNTTARNKMIMARSELVLEHPFFAHLALRLELREDHACRSAWSDGRVLAYNPTYIEALPLPKVMGVQCHEVLHLACGHHLRRGRRDPRAWNVACDLAINPILMDAGVELPGSYLDDPKHHGKCAEAIYRALLDKDAEIKGGADKGPEQELDATEEARDIQGSENRDGEQRSAPSDGADDAEGIGEGNDDPGMSGEVRDAPLDIESPGGQDLTLQEEESLRMALAQALRKARESGKLPGGLERLVRGMLSPALNWRELLRRFMCNAAKSDFSWVRPDRRHLHAGLYLPSLYNEELAEVAVAVDVSGSITQAELDSIASELSALLEEFDASLIVFTCDAALTTQERRNKWDLPLDFQAKGGGGTDFRPPFSSLATEEAAPACLIYFTDMECDRYPEEPAYPVLWVTPNPAHSAPPFGEIIVMEETT